MCTAVRLPSGPPKPKWIGLTAGSLTMEVMHLPAVNLNQAWDGHAHSTNYRHFTLACGRTDRLDSWADSPPLVHSHSPMIGSIDSITCAVAKKCEVEAAWSADEHVVEACRVVDLVEDISAI